MLAARAADALAHLAEELTTLGAEVVTVMADVGNIDDVARIREAPSRVSAVSSAANTRRRRCARIH
ncbi:NADP-dependent 3-hydroxy acid dehydrogenase YdfG [Massilia sp. MP_M2]|uniref:hypothetical protein n=1 Tax=Massilia sp. MP_M2 TaxID=3071713 RepID=UPI00319E5EDA